MTSLSYLYSHVGFFERVCLSFLGTQGGSFVFSNTQVDFMWVTLGSFGNTYVKRKYEKHIHKRKYIEHKYIRHKYIRHIHKTQIYIKHMHNTQIHTGNAIYKS